LAREVARSFGRKNPIGAPQKKGEGHKLTPRHGGNFFPILLGDFCRNQLGFTGRIEFAELFLKRRCESAGTDLFGLKRREN
jgi:hypothetical protein